MFQQSTAFSDNDDLGKVVDVMDPKKIGRVRIKVPGVHDNVPNEMIPWARPKTMMNGGVQELNVPKLGAPVYVNMADPHEPSYSGNALLDGKLAPELAVNYPNRKGYVDESGTIHYRDQQTKEVKTVYSNGVTQTLSGAGAATVTAPQPITHEVEGGAKIVMSSSGTTVTKDTTFQHNTTTQGNTQVQGNSSVQGNVGIGGSAAIGGNTNISGAMNAASGTIGGKPINTDPPLSKASLKQVLGYTPIGLPGFDPAEGPLGEQQIRQLLGSAAGILYGDTPLGGSEDTVQVIDVVNQHQEVITPITVKLSAPTFVYQDGTASPPVQVIDIYAALVNVDPDSLVWSTTPSVTLLPTTKTIMQEPDTSTYDPSDTNPPNDPDVGKTGGTNPYDMLPLEPVVVPDPLHKQMTVAAFASYDKIVVTVTGNLINLVGTDGTPRQFTGTAVITRDDNLSPTLREQIEAVAGELATVIDEYGSLGALVDAAELAANNAVLAKNLAEAAVTDAEAEALEAYNQAVLAGGYATTASTRRDEAAGYAAAAAASALVASTAASAVGLTSNPQFTNGVTGWVDAIAVNASYSTAATMTPVTNYQGDDAVLQNATGTTKYLRGKVTTYVPGRKYRLRARFYTTGSAARVVIGCVGFDAAGAYVATQSLSDHNPAALNTWVVVNVLLDMTTWDGYGYAQFAPYITSNPAAVAGATQSFGYCYLEDVTESESAAASATAANLSAGAANVSATNAGNFASAAQTSSLSAESRARARGLTANADFDLGVLDWQREYSNAMSYVNPALHTPQTNWNGAGAAIVNSSNTRYNLRGSFAPLDGTRKYRLKGRFYVSATMTNWFGVVFCNAAGVYQTNAQYVTSTAPTVGWNTFDILILGSDWSSHSYFAPYAATNQSNTTATMGIDYFYVEDVTESEAAAVSAAASASSATTAGTAATNAGNSAAAAASSALMASAKNNVRGLTSNADFIVGTTDWRQSYASLPGDTTSSPQGFVADTNWNGVPTLIKTLGVPYSSARGSIWNPQAGRKYKMNARYYATATNRIVIGFSKYDAAGAFITTKNMFDTASITTGSWVTYSQLIADADLTHPISAPFFLANFSGETTNIGLDYCFIEDVTESWTAESQATISTNSAATATAQASTATTQAGLSATYASDSRIHAANADVPSSFERDGAYYFFGYEGSPTSVTPIVPNANVTFVNVTGIGRVCQVAIPSGSASDISSIGVVQMQAGRNYRVSIKHRTLSGTRPLQLYMLHLKADYTYQAVAGAVSTPSATTTWTTTVINVSGDTALAAGAVYARMLLRTNTGTSETVQYAFAKIEDVTESTTSAAQATIATNQATLADGYRAAAAVQSNLAATYKADTIRINGNFDFINGKENWYSDQSRTTSLVPISVAVIEQGAAGWPRALRFDPGGTYNIFSGTFLTVNTSRKYRIRSRINAYYPSGTAVSKFYVGFVGLDGSGNIVSHGAYGTYRYAATQGEVSLANGQSATLDVIVTGEGNDSWLKFPPGTKQIQPMAILDYTGSSNYTYIEGIFIEDVTEQQSALNSASIATSQSAAATASAAAAQASMVLAASFGKGYLNANANFMDWPTSGHTNPGSGWVIWNDIGGTTVERYAITGLGIGANQRPEGSDWYFKSTLTTATAETGLATSPSIVADPGKYLIEATTILQDGTYGGSGVLCYFLDAGEGYIAQAKINFATDPDMNGATGTNYLIRRFSKTVTTPAGTKRIRLYAMAGYSDMAGYGASTKVIGFLSCGIKSASDTDAQVAVHASTLATHDLKLASYVTRVSAGSGTAEIAMVALDSGGVPASTITIKADKIRLGSISQPALEIVGGVATFFGELNVGGASGDRVNITQNLIRVVKSSVDIVKIGIW